MSHLKKGAFVIADMGNNCRGPLVLIVDRVNNKNQYPVREVGATGKLITSLYFLPAEKLLRYEDKYGLGQCIEECRLRYFNGYRLDDLKINYELGPQLPKFPQAWYTLDAPKFDS